MSFSFGKKTLSRFETLSVFAAPRSRACQLPRLFSISFSCSTMRSRVNDLARRLRGSVDFAGFVFERALGIDAPSCASFDVDGCGLALLAVSCRCFSSARWCLRVRLPCVLVVASAEVNRLAQASVGRPFAELHFDDDFRLDPVRFLVGLRHFLEW